jgi:predicted dienelactone hydrolase
MTQSSSNLFQVAAFTQLSHWIDPVQHMETEMRCFSLAILVLSMTGQIALADTGVGFKQTVQAEKGNDRPLKISLWYPVNETVTKAETVGENPVFYGLGVEQDVLAAPGKHPLVLLSHGYGGSWRNLNWLAGELVQSGYIVAAPDHPGTTFQNMDDAEALRLLERPRDISRTLTVVLENTSLAGEIDDGKIAVIGHSLGGWTAIELAGGRYQADRALKDCTGDVMPAQCKDLKLMARIGIVGGGKARPELSQDLKDKRIRAAVSLDLGPASGFVPDSLAAIDISVLVYAAGHETAEIAAIKSDSEYLRQHLPASSTPYREIGDATHFSFVQTCKPGADKIIEEESPAEGFVCRDGGGRNRADIHREIADGIVSFLHEAMK